MVDLSEGFLKNKYSVNRIIMPVLVAEFRVPSSRGKAYDSKYSGYNQGNHDETVQGQIVVRPDIPSANMAPPITITAPRTWIGCSSSLKKQDGKSNSSRKRL